MRLTYFKFLLVIFSILFGCKDNKSNKVSEANDELYPDGAYCADVIYYDNDTDKTIEYTLNVEVKNGKLTKILWANGGWMDETQFTPTLVDINGFCIVLAKGSLPYQYTITITGKECLVTDSPQTFGPYEGIITRSQCAANYGASAELFSAYLNDYNLTAKYTINADERITFQDCALMHEGLTTFIRMREPSNLDKGFIQKVFTKYRGIEIICQTMVVQQNGVNYLLEIEGGNSTMGQTVYDPNSEKWLVASFDPNIDGWHEIFIQENPEVDGWTDEVARVLLSGSKAELEHHANYFCR